MTTMVQRSTAYHCAGAMLRNVGTGPQGVLVARGEGAVEEEEVS